ncbi:MAG: hypothetical protein K6B44_11420 [Lachnospiraceae bacterium]|nr:hypothetical protein [Lachnospiraceae bacterium]
MNGEYELYLEIHEGYEVIEADTIKYKVSIGDGEIMDAAILLGSFKTTEALAEWSGLESFICSLILSIELKRNQEAMIILVNRDTREMSLIININIERGRIKFDLDDYRTVISGRE